MLLYIGPSGAHRHHEPLASEGRLANQRKKSETLDLPCPTLRLPWAGRYDTVILIELLGATLLLLGSFLVIHAVWQADNHGAAEAPPSRKPSEPPYRRAA